VGSVAARRKSTAKKGKADKPKKPLGRPTRYSEGIAAEYLRRLALGETGTKICKDPNMPSRTTIWNWGDQDPLFLERLRAARVQQAESGFEEIQDIADDLSTSGLSNEQINRARVRIDARKFRVARLNRELYGDTKTHKVQGGEAHAPPVKLRVAASVSDLKETVDILQSVLVNGEEGDGGEQC
jgi:hypothetical protein